MSTQKLKATPQTRESVFFCTMKTKSKGTFTIFEAAEYMGIGRNAMYALVRTADFPSIKLGERTIVIPKAALEEWLKEKALKGTQK
jgi:DNA binding domain, excisionase family